MFGIVRGKPLRISEQFYNVKYLYGFKKLENAGKRSTKYPATVPKYTVVILIEHTIIW
jgi:hypothetical protein